MGTVVIGLGVVAGTAAIYKILMSKSGSLSIFTFRFSWGN